MAVFKKKEKKENIAVKKEISGILINPCITEKATLLEEHGYYIFKVARDANKKTIKNAVEDKYKVNVDDVKVINVPRKKVFSGRRNAGYRSGFRKALVKIKEGEKIDITK